MNIATTPLLPFVSTVAPGPRGDRAPAAPPADMYVALEAPASKVGRALAQNGHLLDGFSGDLKMQIGSLSDAQLQVLRGGISGQTSIGPISVDNRKAFVKGSVLGKSIWGNVHQSITDARGKYRMIDASEERALHRLIDSVKDLSKDERARLAALVDRV